MQLPSYLKPFTAIKCRRFGVTKAQMLLLGLGWQIAHTIC